MSKFLTVVLVVLAALAAHAQAAPRTVVFQEPGFPAADSAAAPAAVFPSSAVLANTEQLANALRDPACNLLVLPYGSAFPEEAWPDISAYLRRGGNLLVLGGRPFTRAAYHTSDGWHLRDYSVRFTRPLMIDQYETTPGSDGLQFATDPDSTLRPPPFAWKQAFSPVIRLSAVDVYPREGSAGSIDGRLDALAWGVKQGRKLSAPLIQIDHWRNAFVGGRWIFLDADLPSDFYTHQDSAKLIHELMARAVQGSQEFTVRPTLPLYLPGEPPQLDIVWHGAAPAAGPLTLKISVIPESNRSAAQTFTVAMPAQETMLPPVTGKGLYIVEAQLLEGSTVRAFYRSGFWISDPGYLRSGPRLSVNSDYFELDGKPLAVVGTTYMSSETQRLYFDHPNVAVWDRDMTQIQSAGLNMLRTGWWTGWDKFCDENGVPYERTLRTLEAYLMTARKHGLPVQFTFFAFLPDALRGANAYLDPAAVDRERTLVSTIAARFHDVPFLAYDLINEPSIGQHLWEARPNGDSFEVAAWNAWLAQRYPDRAALAAAWNLPAAAADGPQPLPDPAEFARRGAYAGHNSLKVYDYFLFSQQVFDDWVRTMRDAIRATGSHQLVTVGQDEGGIQDRLSPAFWGAFTDFTTNHSWWQNDHLLWDSLFAKQPGKAMLMQETGIQRELNLDETARRTPQNDAALLERKVAASFIEGAGAIEWLWNTNSYMTFSNETPIGAVRPDQTERPEAGVLRTFAAFAKPLSEHLRGPQQPDIAIIASQAAQYSVLADFQIAAQQKAVRALAYGSHLTAYTMTENQIAKLGTPKLAILPSPQALTDAAWEALLHYVNDGGNLLITGPVERNEHWQRVARAAGVRLEAILEPLTYHNATLQLGGHTLTLSFDQAAQGSLEAFRVRDGWQEISYGKGKIFWAAYPVELATNADAATAIYNYVAGRIGITPAFETETPVPPSVLIYPTVLQDSVLYVMLSDSATDASLAIRDKLTGVRFQLSLASQHAALALIGKKENSVIVKFGY